MSHYSMSAGYDNDSPGSRRLDRIVADIYLGLSPPGMTFSFFRVTSFCSRSYASSTRPVDLEDARLMRPAPTIWSTQLTQFRCPQIRGYRHARI